MRTDVEIVVQSSHVPASTYQCLAEMCPGPDTSPYGIRVVLPESDPKLAKILGRLADDGLTLHSGVGRLESGTYELRRHRTYDSSDLDQYDYLQMYQTQLISQEQKRDGSGILQIPASALEKPFQIGGIVFHAIVVNGDLKERLVNSGMKGMQFKPVTAVRKGACETSPNVWELTSSVRMPPHTRPDELVCFNSTRFSGDYSKVVGIEQDYRPAELHYRKDDISKIEPVDFALTFETFPQERWTVVSQRFRQFCLKEKLKLEWIPVRVEA